MANSEWKLNVFLNELLKDVKKNWFIVAYQAKEWHSYREKSLLGIWTTHCGPYNQAGEC